MDRIEQLALRATDCAVCFGNTATGEFILVRLECEPPVDEPTARLIIRAIPSYLVPLSFQKRGDSVEFLERLFNLEDTRNDFGPS